MAPRLITVFGSSRSLPGSAAFEEAVAFGQTIARAGFGVATGGYAGAMEAVSWGVKQAGGTTVGVTAPDLFKTRRNPNPHLDLEFRAPSLPARIARLLDLGEAALAFPGGVGTLTELALAWNLIYVEKQAGLYSRPLFVHQSWQELLRPGLEISAAELELLHWLSSPEELAEALAEL